MDSFNYSSVSENDDREPVDNDEQLKRTRKHCTSVPQRYGKNANKISMSATSVCASRVVGSDFKN